MITQDCIIAFLEKNDFPATYKDCHTIGSVTYHFGSGKSTLNF